MLVPDFRILQAPQDEVRDRLLLPTALPTNSRRDRSQVPEVRVKLDVAGDQSEPE
jgi:hypothetical protein